MSGILLASGIFMEAHDIPLNVSWVWVAKKALLEAMSSCHKVS